MRVWATLGGGVVLGLGAVLAVQAQDKAFKCVARGSVTYTQVPCPGAREVRATTPRRTDKTQPVPQDRAKIARRATLSAEEREECRALDARLVEQRATLKALGDSVTLQDEMPMVQTQKRLRELRC